MEEQVPNGQSSDENRIDDRQLEIGLPARTGKQYNLVTGRAERPVQKPKDDKLSECQYDTV